MTNAALVEAKDLYKYFPIYAGLLSRHVGDVSAVDGVSFTIQAGRNARARRRVGLGQDDDRASLAAPAAGRPKARSISKGANILTMKRGDIRRLRRSVQIIFQDPFASLNPRMTVGEIVAEPIRIHDLAKGKDADDRVRELLRPRRPAALSREPLSARVLGRAAPTRRDRARAGGPAQASSSATSPSRRWTSRFRRRSSTCSKTCKRQFGLTYLFIAHDLSVVRHISTRVAVMYVGKIVELAVSRRPLREPAASLHAGAALGDSDSRSGRRETAQAHRPDGRHPLAGQSAVGLPLSHPLPDRVRALQSRGAAAARICAGALRRVSLGRGTRRQSARPDLTLATGAP